MIHLAPQTFNSPPPLPSLRFPFSLSLCLSLSLSQKLSQTNSLSIPSFIYPSIYLSTYLSIYLSIYLTIPLLKPGMIFSLYIYLSTYLSISPSPYSSQVWSFRSQLGSMKFLSLSLGFGSGFESANQQTVKIFRFAAPRDDSLLTGVTTNLISRFFPHLLVAPMRSWDVRLRHVPYCFRRVLRWLLVSI